MEARTRRMEIILTFAVIASWWAGAMGQSSSCTNALMSLSPCLLYITGNSSTPTPQCCTQLAAVVRSQPQCLCEVINGGVASLGINVNLTQALALPNACQVQTPPISSCNASSPANSPAEAPGSPSGGGSAPPRSDGNSNRMTFSVLFFLLFVASYASSYPLTNLSPL
ncbi:hypothetical protein P3X46_015279 [Hevea brasiliensis]|uniref:Bifunctional inhibitor/plant lipid transfer protein/seed storage helical domain-containing protein n=1 Tax=Hevea brasiliensis TaxID=3981 RepID=A0ABQ9LVN8_HEVBR|nr:non-specific lipid transfer protein GPI-anchored 5 [Hevea brasiliensis]KAJ9171986.1 hypothetical protein P3X46_015279 [Hevea brasiliensis]